MQKVQLLTLVNILLLLAATTTKVTAQAIEAENIDALKFMPFHPISRAEYDAILGLTNGQKTISEARLTASGIAALKGLIAGLTAGLSSTFLAPWVGGSSTSTTTFSDGYPLCVINANAGRKPVIKNYAKQNYNQHDQYQHDYNQHDYNQHDYNQHDYNQHDQNEYDQNQYDHNQHNYNGHDYNQQDHYQHDHEYQPEDKPHSPYYDQQTMSPNPLVNCIVVVKKKREGDEQSTEMPTEAPKPEPYNPWQQNPQYHHGPEHSWYGYPSAAHYGYPPPPPPLPLPPYHHYRSDPIYPRYPSINSGYQRYSAYPQYPAPSLYARQQPSFQVNEQKSPEVVTEPPPPSTTPAPILKPTITRKPTNSRPHIHSLKPIKHLSQKRKRPIVATEYDANTSNSAENDNESEYAVHIDTPPKENFQHTRPKIQIHKIDPPYHTQNEDQAESTETNTYPHLNAQIKRPITATNHHSNHKKTAHFHHSVRPEQAEQTDYSEHNSQKQKRPSTDHNSYVEYADAVDSAENSAHANYPKRKHSRPAPSAHVDNVDETNNKRHKNRPVADEAISYPHYSQQPSDSDYQSSFNMQSLKPTDRPLIETTTRPRPQKPKKRKHSNNPASQQLHSNNPPQRLQPNEHTPTERPNSSPSKSKRDKTTKYPHIAANYAELAEYPHDSYQPAQYPQLNYQSTYPKISYSQAQPNPAPVYMKKTKVPNTSTTSTSTEVPEFGIDSSESENSAEFIKVRQSDYDE